jgi:hypothetical protein
MSDRFVSSWFICYLRAGAKAAEELAVARIKRAALKNFMMNI